MNEFFLKLKAEANANPVFTVAAAAATITAIAKLVDSVSATRGRHAYAKQVNYRIKHKK